MAGRSGHGHFAAYRERGLVRKMRLILVVQVRMYIHAGRGGRNYSVAQTQELIVQLAYKVPKGMKASRPREGIRHS